MRVAENAQGCGMGWEGWDGMCRDAQGCKESTLRVGEGAGVMQVTDKDNCKLQN